MTSELANAIAEVVQVTGDQSLHDDIDLILERHQELVARFEHADSPEAIDAAIENEELAIEAKIASAGRVADQLSANWTSETETRIAESKEFWHSIVTMQDALKETLAQNDIEVPFSDQGTETDQQVEKVRRQLLAQRLSVLNSSIAGMQSQLTSFRAARRWRIRILQASHVFWRFAFPFIFVLLGFFTFDMSPLTGIAVALGLFAINWTLDQWVFQPWLARRYTAQQKRDTISTINAFSHSRIIMQCHLAMLTHQVQRG